MLSDTDIEAMLDAAQKRLTISFEYVKKETGELVTHTGGVTKIDSSVGAMWLWDTGLNDHIRRFILQNMGPLRVLPMPFDNAAAGGYPLEINGQIIAGV